VSQYLISIVANLYCNRAYLPLFECPFSISVCTNILYLLSRLFPLSGQEDSYPWDAIVTVDNNATAASAGKKIAQAFTKFAAEKKNRGLFGNNKIVEFVFKGALPEEEKGRPLTYYLVDDDAVRVFLLVFYDGTNKKELMECGKLLKDFFGSMEIGLTLLEQYAKW